MAKTKASIKQKNRRKTLFLALFAAATFVYSAIFHFDVEPALMLSFFWQSALMVGLAIACAVVMVALLRFIRR